jgi:hypothetical protein
MAHTGSCHCGAVEIEVEGEPEAQGYCHCASCRVHSGAPVAAFTLWGKDKVRVTRGEETIAGFNKTGMSDRRFCTRCGGHVFIDHPGLGMIDVRVGVLKDFDFKPAVHLNYAETVLPMRDGLPKLRDFPAEIGGSGETMAE